MLISGACEDAKGYLDANAWPLVVGNDIYLNTASEATRSSVRKYGPASYLLVSGCFMRIRCDLEKFGRHVDAVLIPDGKLLHGTGRVFIYDNPSEEFGWYPSLAADWMQYWWSLVVFVKNTELYRRCLTFPRAAAMVQDIQQACRATGLVE